MSSNYASFQIKNTTDAPIVLSVRDPDGDVRTVGKLAPGKKSLQVAPLDAAWSMEGSKVDSEEPVASPPRDQQQQISAPPDSPRIEVRTESLEDLADSEPIHYEAFLKIETGSHTARINQLLVTPDGKSLITSGEDKTIRIWDMETRQPAGILRGQIGDGAEGKIQAIAVSPDGKYVVALIWVYPEKPDQGRQEAEVRESDLRVFELATGNLQASYHYAGTLCDLDFSSDGKYLALIVNPRDFVRRSYVYLLESKEIVQGFGTLPPATENHVSMLYESYIPYMVLPSYIRFVPQEPGAATENRLVVATWVYNPGAEEEGEYTGRIYWYACSAEGLKEIQSCETAEAQRKDPAGVYSIRPVSLAVSREFVITTAESQEIKEFFCHDHQGQLVVRVNSETVPSRPVFSNDGSLLIVGQRKDASLVEVKVYNSSGGQFQMKSTYYGHDAEVFAAALHQEDLDQVTAVSAGGDQNAIHFWSLDHLEGEQLDVIRGVGRAVYAVGINEQEQIGIGNHVDMLLENGRIGFQRIFDLRSLTLQAYYPDDHDSAGFQRSQTAREGKNLEYENIRPYPNLYLDHSYPGLVQGDWYYPTTFGFTPKGSVITGADDGKVRVVARASNGWQAMLPPRILVGHTARVLDHAASSKWLVTAGKDQVVRLWYMEDVEQETTTDLEPALNLFVGMDDEWVLWSKSGYYTASKDGDRYLGYHVNRGPAKEALFFSSDRFHSVFFRPDIIEAILACGSEERAAEQEAASQISIQPVNVAEILPPVVELDEDGVQTFEDERDGYVTFTLTIASHGKPITRLCVLRNGRLLHVETSIPLSGKLQISRLPLLPGDNRFKIFAENQDAQSHVIKSNPIEYTVRGKGRFEDEIIEENGTLYILAIGVSQGIHLVKREAGAVGTFELGYAHKDADAIYQTFLRGNTSFEKGVESKLLVNEEATLENILRTLDEIAQGINQRVEDRIVKGERAKRDVLIVFLSGHGVYRIKNQQLYFWNYDFDLDQPAVTGLSFMELGEKITSLPAEAILMTDACHSGMAGSDVLKGLGPENKEIDPNELAKRIYGINESDMYIFNAARRSESALEGSSVEHGYFTKAIIDTLLQSTDLGVTMLGLIDQVQWRVTKDKPEQHPICRMYGDLLPLVIYKK